MNPKYVAATQLLRFASKELQQMPPQKGATIILIR